MDFALDKYVPVVSCEKSNVSVPITALTVQGSSISIPSGSSSYAAIDTGTTLVGGPSDIISEIYAQIPGSAVGTGDLEGYYTFRK